MNLGSIAIRVALADDNLSDEEIKDLADMPEYESIEAFVDEVLNDVNGIDLSGEEPTHTFNLSDVQTLVWRAYKDGRPTSNKKVIDELKSWGLKYVPRSSDMARMKAEGLL